MDIDDDLRKEYYEKHGLPSYALTFSKYLLPKLEQSREESERYQPKQETLMLAEVALTKAYFDVVKFRPLLWMFFILGLYDYLHPLPVSTYGVLAVGYAGVMSAQSNLRGRYTLAAEVEGIEDENGLPGDFKARAAIAASSNVILVLFILITLIQLGTALGWFGSELLAENIFYDSNIHPVMSAAVAFLAAYAGHKVIG